MNRKAVPPPVPPVEPEPWQCCGSGCEPCVYDRYWQDLERYEEALERWRQAEVQAGRDPAAGDGPAGPKIDKAGGCP